MININEITGESWDKYKAIKTEHNKIYALLKELESSEVENINVAISSLEEFAEVIMDVFGTHR